MNEKQKRQVVEESEVATVLVDENGKVVSTNESAKELYRTDELEGQCVGNQIRASKIKVGKALANALDGEQDTEVWACTAGDGTILEVEITPELVTIGGEKYILCENELVGEKNPIEETDCDSEILEDVPDAEITEIAKSIRIESDDGKIPLNTIVYDIAVMQNEIEQSKHGAYTLQRILNERLAEEKRSGTKPVVCEIIRQVRDSARDLYLRIERGDRTVKNENNKLPEDTDQ